jgi:hypothetical protein
MRRFRDLGAPLDVFLVRTGVREEGELPETHPRGV